MTLRQPLLGENYVTQKKEENKNNPKNSGHYIATATPDGSTQTSLKPKTLNTTVTPSNINVTLSNTGVTLYDTTLTLF